MNIYGVCFIPLDANAPRLFGFPEFLTGLALIVLAWTIADIRYRFRISVAPVPLQSITFGVVASLGVLTIATDLWRAQEWLVPCGNLLTPASWQAILAGLFLFTFLSWAWFAFIRPSIFGRSNSSRFSKVLYRFILRGSPLELAVIADELAASVNAIIHHATDRPVRFKGEVYEYSPSKTERHADEILLLIADKRFCRAIVEFAPVTAYSIFNCMSDLKKYRIKINAFASNVVSQALIDKNSFLYHEVEGYQSGLIGYQKPLSQAMFANFDLVQTVGTMLDPGYSEIRKWDAEQWEAYNRAILMVFHGYLESDLWNHSTVLYRAFKNISDSVSDLYKLNDGPIALDTEEIKRLRAAVDFIRELFKALEGVRVPEYQCLRLRENGHLYENVYDRVAGLIFDMLVHVSSVKSPQQTCWFVQHNLFWGEIFDFGESRGQAARIIQFKLRRLIYDEVKRMSPYPNFVGAKVIGLCLNIMGFELSARTYHQNCRALHKAVLSWVRKNYASVELYNPLVAEACLVSGISFEKSHLRLARTYPANGLRPQPQYVYFDLDPGSASFPT